MVIILKVHIQPLRHLGMVTFNSSSVADIRLLINFDHVGVTPSDGVTQCVPQPRTHLATP